jgi:cytochrome c oxidase subunit III
MGTTVHEPPVRRPRMGGSGGDRGPLRPQDGDMLAVTDHSPEPVRTGIWVALAGITMMFAAFTSALVVREGSANDWMHIVLPPIMYLNTAVLVASSATLEVARRRVGEYVRAIAIGRARPLRWMFVTLGLGLLFVAGQLVAWQQLKAQGIYLSTNPTSSFFYVLTAVHAVHVLGGLGGLVRVVAKLTPARPQLRKSTFAATSYYWHFMGALWIYLLAVIWLKL